jgi:toxin-antitoxin system PIN domain toxin
LQLPDINVLIYSHRADAPEHEKYAIWLKTLVTSRESFAVSTYVLSGFLRIVTNPRIFKPATPMATAVAYCQELLKQPRAVVALPTHRHWRLLTDLCISANIRGPLVSDAYLAALAIEHGCELVTTDSDFARFEGLRWRHPLSPGNPG